MLIEAVYVFGKCGTSISESDPNFAIKKSDCILDEQNKTTRLTLPIIGDGQLAVTSGTAAPLASRTVEHFTLVQSTEKKKKSGHYSRLRACPVRWSFGSLISDVVRTTGIGVSGHLRY